ncbi:MAG: sulfur carrier protein ThiS [Desulfuromonadales bacterium]|nr:sulfur carrier protein ThiS [Desulfuromonadales bacterium]NIR33665.1 sulfur carrier protein ThiS [Desulfuromonadales bacterium]NIS43560.1 sulfur carrier protein ThiS [Desulfuromonadales bacterium]
MTLTVNGKARELEAETSITGLLEQLELDPQRVAVELNRDIVPRERFGDTSLADGDRVEVVQFVGGG